MPTRNLWAIEVDGRPRIRIFGGGPALPAAWSDPEIEAFVRAIDVLWNEVPNIGPEGQALAIRYGVDPAGPLATWLAPDDLARVERAGGIVGVSMQLLAPLRPWLAAQILKMAAESRAGLHGEYSAEQHLVAVAEKAGVPVRSEFPAGEALFVAFASWPRAAEVDRLRSTVAEIEAGLDSLVRQSEAWLASDLQNPQEIDDVYRADYPALYEHLVVGRNRAWVERIIGMMEERTTAFVVVGTGHLVGPDGIPALLERAGIAARRS